MEIKLTRVEARNYVPRLRLNRTLPISGELVVPDTVEDLNEVFSLRGMPLLKEKELSGGVLRLNGELKGTALALDQKGELVAVPFTRPFTLEEPVEGELREELCQVALRLSFAEARLSNPRKLSLSLELSLDLCCWDEQELLLSQEAEPERGLHPRMREEQLRVVKTVTEKSFTLSEQFPAPEGAEALLWAEAVSLPPEIQALGSRCVIKGELLIRAAFGGESPLLADFRLPYSQILDTGGEGTESYISDTELCAVYCDFSESLSGERMLDCEIHMLAQTLGLVEETRTLIGDAFSNQAPLNLQWETETAYSQGELSLQELQLSGEVEKYPGELLAYLPGAVQCRPGKEKLRLSAPMDLLLRQQDGDLHAQRRTLNGELSAPEENVRLLSLSVSEAEPETMRLTLCLQKETRREEQILSSMELREEEPYRAADYPSVSLVRRTDDLWAIARRCHADPQRIQALNPEGAGLLLVPREN